MDIKGKRIILGSNSPRRKELLAGLAMASIIANQFGEADDLRLSSLIAIGLVLFLITALINIIGKIMIKRARIV